MCAQTTWSMNMTAPTSCFGESHRFGVVCICAARHSKTLNSQLEAELSTFVQGNPCLMPLSSLLWVFLVITFSGREASKRGCECSGWKACTQVHGASQGLGEERIGEKQASYDFNFLSLDPKELLHYFIHCFIFVFWFFSPQDLVWPRKLLKTSQMYPATWGSQSPWIVGMKQVGAITTFTGTSNFPVDRWLTLFTRVQKWQMQGKTATL